MNFKEYATLHAAALADLIRSGKVPATEVAATATDAISAVNRDPNTVAENPIGPLDYSPADPLAGVPFAIKGIVCHAAGVPTRIGAQLEGPSCSETMPLRSAARLADAMPWSDRRPTTHVTSITASSNR